MHDSVNAIASCGVSPIVRIRGPDPTIIKRALDTGAQSVKPTDDRVRELMSSGLMVPMINTAQQAKDVVTASKFPPVGIRGQGSPFSAMASGLTTPEYLRLANETLLTIVQIETAEGLGNVDEICQVGGVDAIFIGPNDLAMSLLGYAPANYDEPVFLDALKTIRESARKHGKPCGILVPEGSKAKGLDYEIIAIGGDVKALNLWMTRELKVAKGL